MRTFSIILSGTIARPFERGAADAAVASNALAPNASETMAFFILNSSVMREVNPAGPKCSPNRRFPLDIDTEIEKLECCASRSGGWRIMTDNPMRRGEVDTGSDADRCGARTRTGQPCKSATVRGRRRCRMHGGAR